MSLAVAKRMRNNEVVQDDKWNKNILHFDYILNEVDQGAHKRDKRNCGFLPIGGVKRNCDYRIVVNY